MRVLENFWVSRYLPMPSVVKNVVFKNLGPFRLLSAEVHAYRRARVYT